VSFRRVVHFCDAAIVVDGPQVAHLPLPGGAAVCLCPSSRPRAGFALLDLLLAAILVTIGALGVAVPLTEALASLDAARRAHRRVAQLADAAGNWAAAARRGDCAPTSAQFGAVQAVRVSAPPGVQLQLRIQDSAGPPRRRRTDSLVVWVPCGPSLAAPAGSP